MQRRLEELRLEQRRLLINRETLEMVCNKLSEMMKRRQDVTAKSRDTFLQLQSMAAEESTGIELNSPDHEPVNGHSVSMAVITYSTSLLWL